VAITRSLILIAVAVVCFLIGFLIAVGAVNGNDGAWLFGGLASFAAAHLP
jgi:hypothetical protein